MITILFAPPRTGKTCLLTHIACETAFDYQRNRLMQREILKKHFNGFENINTMPKHCVSANYDITMHKFGYRVRRSRLINAYKLGFFNVDVNVHFNLPYEAIFITEAQMYLNSRMNSYYPDWQSRWYEQQCCKPKFYQGHFQQDFDYQVSDVVEETKDGYKKYLFEHKDDLPTGFYKKRGGDK